MTANTIIHTIVPEQQICIISLYDDDKLILDHVNIGIPKNANTDHIVTYLKEYL